MSVLIIAEAGVNHNGSIERAYQLVDAAVVAGVDVVKFQTFRAEKLVSRFAEKAEYQKRETAAEESQLEMLKKLEFSEEQFRRIQAYCREKGILFISTPFDEDSLELLEQLEMPFYKIPSGEITNLPFLIQIAKLRKPVIMSTGMSTMEEISLAVDILARYGVPEISILHCNTEYPTPYKDVNLLAMLQLREKFGLKVGYSDHTLGIEVPVAAVALGAEIIEKHFTLDKTLPGPDHKASLSPEELRDMVTAIRHIEQSLGNGVKEPSTSERKNLSVARKSIVAKKFIKKGEIFTEDNLSVKRPGTGISPLLWFEVLGQSAKRDFEEDELIEQ
ncbi:N-acetylneuraminate synthase [Paenibacillus sp. NFR01]|uniref:N-acetylneuraminate synthase n=1 Tax=Paenibacillus sp. NFR01 TaxID=1566279 RepID=UPI0008BC6B31|nr:N-acetylneuraminate synthase [Paenibacillus sp. NFR01]SEU14294.1 N-acetylneuraminate synthase [Paenibacillus sp. NFR01]